MIDIASVPTSHPIAGKKESEVVFGSRATVKNSFICFGVSLIVLLISAREKESSARLVSLTKHVCDDSSRLLIWEDEMSEACRV